MIFTMLICVLLPSTEHYLYETNDKGKIGTMDISVEKDTIGFHVLYTWEDRILEVIFDTLDMSTVYVKKTAGKKVELEIKREEKFNVVFRGRRYTYGYENHAPIYDRHAIEYAIRGFSLGEGFKKTIRFHVPEYMVINADVHVIDQEVVTSPIGDILCWKVEMKPNVWFINWRFYFWIEVEYPHKFVQYKDSSGKNTIMLIEYTRGK
jgi:hypothetical protein